jgi:hypothetical protein
MRAVHLMAMWAVLLATSASPALAEPIIVSAKACLDVDSGSRTSSS